MRNKKCEITITLSNYSVEEIVLKLAEYVNDGFHINSVQTSASCRDMEYTVDLVKYGEQA